MTDRNVQYPQRYQLSKVEGTDDVYDLIPAPGEVGAEGTLINKATLLQDSTAALYGLGTDAVPDDVFKQIPKTVGFQVGDIRTTVKTDLGEKWLLCNGAVINRSTYPNLAAMFPFTVKDPYRSLRWLLKSSVKSRYNSINGIAYANGHYVAAGKDSRGFDESDASIVYFGDNIQHSQRTVLTIWGQDPTRDPYQNEFINIKYLNGNFVAFGTRHIKDRDDTPYDIYYGALAYASDPTAVSNWTTAYLWGDDYDSKSIIYDMTYANGYYVAVGHNTNGSYYSAIVAWSKSLDGPWAFSTLIEQRDSSYLKAMTVQYINGEYVVGGCSRISSRTASIWHTATLGSSGSTTTWTEVPISDVNNVGDGIYKLIYVNGYYIALIDPTGSEQKIAFAKTLLGPWDEYALDTTGAVDIYYNNGYYIVTGYEDAGRFKAAFIMYSNSLYGPWKKLYLWQTGNSFSYMRMLYNDNTHIFVGGSSDCYIASGTGIPEFYPDDGANNTSLGIMAHTDSDRMALPEISVDAAYVYIKAKE